ncbi:splicing factor 1 isoform X1 [Balamuthia mandrillaris]
MSERASSSPSRRGEGEESTHLNKREEEDSPYRREKFRSERDSPSSSGGSFKRDRGRPEGESASQWEEEEEPNSLKKRRVSGAAEEESEVRRRERDRERDRDRDSSRRSRDRESSSDRDRRRREKDAFGRDIRDRDHRDSRGYERRRGMDEDDYEVDAFGRDRRGRRDDDSPPPRDRFGGEDERSPPYGRRRFNDDYHYPRGDYMNTMPGRGIRGMGGRRPPMNHMPPMRGMSRGGFLGGGLHRGGLSRRPWNGSDYPYPSGHGYVDNYDRGRQSEDMYDMPLKSYKQFLLTQDDSIGPDEAAKKYEEYKEEYMRKRSFAFFQEHKDEEWFQEKYKPEVLERKRKEKMERAQHNTKIFFEQLESGFDYSLDASESSSPETSHNQDSKPEDDGDKNEKSKHEEEEGEVGSSQQAEKNGEEDAMESEGDDKRTVNGTKKESKEEEEKSEQSEQKEGEEKPRLISTKPANPRTLSSGKLDISLSDLSFEKKPKKNFNAPRVVEAPREPYKLFIKGIPPSCTKAELKDVLTKAKGFTKLVLSEPMKYKNFSRLGWAVFDNNDNMRSALHEFNGHKMKGFDLKLSLTKRHGREEESSKYNYTPPKAAEEERISKDVEATLALIKSYDEQREIQENPLLSETNPDESLKDRLDKNIAYLRKVHSFCYYCAEEFEDEEELTRQCGEKHLRGNRGTHAADIAENDWVAQLDAKITSLLESPPDPDIYTGKKVVEEKTEEFLNDHVVKQDEEKYRCAIRECSKLFCGANFVKKHLRLKHSDLLKQAIEKATESQYFNNYMNDPRRIEPNLPEPGGGGASSSSALLAASPTSGGSRHSRLPISPPPVTISHTPHPPPVYPPGHLTSEAVNAGLINPFDLSPSSPSAAPSATNTFIDTPRPAPFPRHPRSAPPLSGPPPSSLFRGGGRGGRRHHHPPPFGATPIVSFGSPSAPPPGFAPDPRAATSLRQYVDLDAPAEDVPIIDYRTSIDYGDLDAASTGSSSSSSSSSSADASKD